MRGVPGNDVNVHFNAFHVEFEDECNWDFVSVSALYEGLAQALMQHHPARPTAPCTSHAQIMKGSVETYDASASVSGKLCGELDGLRNTSFTVTDSQDVTLLMFTDSLVQAAGFYAEYDVTLAQGQGALPTPHNF